MSRLTIEPAEIYQRYMYWRSLGHCAVVAYLNTFQRRLEIDLVHFPDPRRKGNRRHWQRTSEWANAVACVKEAQPWRAVKD